MTVKEPESVGVEVAVLVSSMIGLGLSTLKVVQQLKRIQAARKLSK